MAFMNCSSLETVALGAGIKVIDEPAFYDKNLWAFGGCPSLKTIYVPAKKAEYYRKRLPENLHSFIVELPAEKKGK